MTAIEPGLQAELTSDPAYAARFDALLDRIFRDIGDPTQTDFSESASRSDPQPFEDTPRPVRLFDRVTCSLSRVQYDLLQAAIRQTELEAAIEIAKAAKEKRRRAELANGVPY